MARPRRIFWALCALCACAACAQVLDSPQGLHLEAKLQSDLMAGTASDAVHSQPLQTAQDGADAASEVTGAASTVSSASAAGEENWQVLQSSSLKIAVLADGGLGQPFYRSQQTNGWTKLTYGSKHMDCAIKVDGHLAKLSGELDVVKTTASAFAARSQVTLNAVPQAQVLRSYSFLGDGMVFNITFTFTALTDVTDLQVYLGTSDDWIGTSDQPRKEQGHFVQGQFQPEAHGKVLRVQSSDEAVFAFSPNPDSHAIILQHYGNFADVYAATMSPMTKVPCGHLARGETKSATIFYAAAGASELDHLLEVSAKANSAGHAVALPPTPATPEEETAQSTETSKSASNDPKVFLKSNDLKIGVMNDGSLDQPFYYSQSTQRWTKLTYGHKKLDLAVKVNGELATLGSEATIDGGRESTSTSVAVRSQLMVDGVSKGEVLRSYDFVGDGLVLKMTFSFSALTPLSDVKVWLGTSDDWIGEDDRPTKETGDFDHGFVPSKGGKILRVQSGKEEVFAFSPNAGSKAIILQHYGNWPRVYASDQSDVSRSSSDGAYAIYVPLGSIEVGQTKEATIFYAASGANQLEKLAVVSEEADEVAGSNVLA